MVERLDVLLPTIKSGAIYVIDVRISSIRGRERSVPNSRLLSKTMKTRVLIKKGVGLLKHY